MLGSVTPQKGLETLFNLTISGKRSEFCELSLMSLESVWCTPFLQHIIYCNPLLISDDMAL